ncbi:MAG: pitrilysin family protein [Thermoanaerobaculia bacterium]
MQPRPCVPTFVLALALVAGVAGAADIFPYPVHEKTLPNGLRVVAVPYDSPGTVAYFSVVRTGSRDEVEPGKSGFAHFFEHMMFRGTESYPQEAYNDVLKRMGADSNAFTSDDYTCYYIIGPSAEVDTMMEIESDRFENLEYDEDVFRAEALAVRGEYDKNASSPFLPMWERMRELAFDEHTYSHTTMGYLADIQAMPDQYEYSLSFFDRFYRPENVVLLVVGDIDPERIFTMAAEHYGDWERGYEAPAVVAEPPQKERHEDRLEWPNPTRPYLMMGYRAPAFSDSSPETATLDVISQLLFAESAPLYQKLVVDEQWVDFIQGSYNDHRDPFLFTVFARAKSDEELTKTLGAIDEAIAELQSEPVDTARLERIKSHLRYSLATGLDSPGAVGFTLAGYLNLTGDPQSLNRVFEQYAAITPETIQRVAREVFTSERTTLITLGHTEVEDAAPAADGGEEAR